MKSALLIGQSNMAGRGFLHEVKTICDERIFMLRNGRTLAQMVNALRNELEAENIPFLIGGLGVYLGKNAFGANCTEYQQVNQELYRYAEENEACCYVTGKDLYANPDGWTGPYIECRWDFNWNLLFAHTC